jgi:hypothetical protein
MSGEGVWIDRPAVELYNNLIVGHRTAISGTQATWDYSGFYDNSADYAAGLSGGAHDVSGDPRFADRAVFDYHLGPESAMAGQGLDIGVMVDLDDLPRPEPTGTAPDLGAYEVGIDSQRVYLPLVVQH